MPWILPTLAVLIVWDDTANCHDFGQQYWVYYKHSEYHMP